MGGGWVGRHREGGRGAGGINQDTGSELCARVGVCACVSRGVGGKADGVCAAVGGAGLHIRIIEERASELPHGG